jgi:2-polyprenyl-3-methyl-5-hydroxy-6-metoxy-1,4-benzoquinol methylase
MSDQATAAAALREDEIRPTELMDKQREMLLADIDRMLSRQGEFVSVACPACGSAKGRFKFEKNGMRYEDCAECATFFVNPRPSPEVLDWFYRESPNYAYWNDVIFPASEAARREKIFAPRVDRVLGLCRKYGVATGSLLEVGAGFGTFCSELKSRGRFERVVAVEPTPKLAQTCRDRGVEVIEKPVEQIEFTDGEGFDVVANFEVIEHLFDPGAFVAEMARLLNPGGLIVLTCPNGKGFDVETLGPLSNTVDHEHLNYFNPSSLAGLMASQSLTVLESFTPGELDAELVRKKALTGEFDLSGQPFLRKVLIDEWETLGAPFQQFLVANGLSSNMWIVATKA